MATELGVAYVTLTASMGGFNRDIQKQLGGVDAEFDKAGKRAGGRFSGAIGTAMKALGAVGIGAAAAGIGMAFTKGLDRYMKIENAEQKLKALGNSADDVKRIMEGANKAVKGTAFGMGEAADTAAAAVASGIAPGERLDQVLRTIANTAAIAGTDMSSMGAIFNKAAASGKVQGDILAQLGDQGVPAVQFLAKELGVTAEQVYKMASDGKINFETFERAMRNGMDPNAAVMMGDTLKGSWENAQAALGRLGAEFMKVIGPAAKAALDGLIAGLDRITKLVGPALAGLGDAIKVVQTGDFTGGIFGIEEDHPAVGGLLALHEAMTVVADMGNQLWSGLTMPPSVQAEFAASGEPLMGLVRVGTDIRNFFTQLWEDLGSKVAAFGAGFVDGFGGLDAVFSVFKDLLPVLMGPLGILRTALMEVFGSGGISGDAAGFGQTLGSALAPVLTLLGELAGMITGVLAGALAELLPVLLQVGQTLLSALAPVLMQIVPIIAQLATTLLPVFASLFQSLIPVVMQLVSAILPLVAMLVAQLAPVLLNIISALLPPLGLLLEAVASVVGTLVQALAPVITALVAQLAPIITTLVQQLLPPLARVIATVAEVIATVLAPILNVIINVLGTLLVGAINALMPVVTVVFNFIARTIKNVMDVITGIIRLVMAVIRGDWDGAWNAIRQIGAAVWDQIRNVVSTAIGLVMAVIRSTLTTIQAVWNAAWEVIKAVGQAAWDWISRTIASFGDGARNTFQNIVDGIGRIWDGLRDVAARPVRFVIDTIINNGIIKGWNDLVGLLGLPASLRVGRISVPGFRRGGFTGRGRDDEWAGGVHRNEYVMDADTVRDAGGPAAMEALRARIQTGMWPVGAKGELGDSQNTPPQRGLPHIAGLPTDIRRIAQAGPRPGDKGFGGPVDWGMARIGAMGWYRRCLAFVNAAWGYAVGRFRLATARQSQNAGPRTMGGTPPAGAGVFWDTGGAAGHISLAVGDGTELSNDIIVPGRIDRVPSSAFRTRWGARYMGWWHPGGAAGGPGGSDVDGGGPSLLELAMGWITDKLSGPIQRILGAVPGVGMFKDMASAVGKRLADMAVEEIKKKIPGLQMGGQVTRGGLVNLAEDGRPELVFGPQSRYLPAGSTVLNAADTAAYMGGQKVLHYHSHNAVSRSQSEEIREDSAELLALVGAL